LLSYIEVRDTQWVSLSVTVWQICINKQGSDYGSWPGSRAREPRRIRVTVWHSSVVLHHRHCLADKWCLSRHITDGRVATILNKW